MNYYCCHPNFQQNQVIHPFPKPDEEWYIFNNNGNWQIARIGSSLSGEQFDKVEDKMKRILKILEE